MFSSVNGEDGEMETLLMEGAVFATTTDDESTEVPLVAPSLGVTKHTTASPLLKNVPSRVVAVGAIT